MKLRIIIMKKREIMNEKELLEMAEKNSREQLDEKLANKEITEEQFKSICELQDANKNDADTEEVKAEEPVVTEEPKAEEVKAEEPAKVEDQAAQAPVFGNDFADKPATKKSNKGIIIGLVSALFITIIAGVVLFLAFGKTEVDLANYVAITYDKDTKEAMPYVTITTDDYNEEHDYEFEIDYLVDSGFYTESEATALMPTDKIDAKLAEVITDYELSDYIVKNGDTLTVTIEYDEELAKKHRIEIINDTITVEISGLYEDVLASDVTKAVIDKDTFTKKAALDEVDRYLEDSHLFTAKVLDSEHYIITSDNYFDLFSNSDYLLSTHTIKIEDIYGFNVTGTLVAYTITPIYKQDGKVFLDEERFEYDDETVFSREGNRSAFEKYLDESFTYQKV